MINRNRVLEQFRTLAAFDSESFSEQKIAAYLERKLRELGLFVIQDDAGEKLLHERKADGQKAGGKSGPAEGKTFGNLYGRLEGTVPGAAVLFSAHMDTVAPGKQKKVVEHADGKITSDGTTVLGADDLTGIAAILEALTVIRENHLPHREIEVLFTVAEEPYCRGASVFDFSKLHAKTAYVLDLDGPIGTVANAAPSIVQFRVEIKGKSAHAGFEPEKGVSAIAVAAEAISRLQLGRVDEFSTVNIGTIHGGTGKNVVPELAVVEGEIRSSKAEGAERILEKVRQTFLEAALGVGATASVLADEMVSAYHVCEEAEVIRRYEEVLKSLGYGEVTVVQTFGGSDNNALNQHGIEGIVISNGMHQVHTTQEYFYLEELKKSAEIVVGLAL